MEILEWKYSFFLRSSTQGIINYFYGYESPKNNSVISAFKFVLDISLARKDSQFSLESLGFLIQVLGVGFAWFCMKFKDLIKTYDLLIFCIDRE